MEFLGGSISDLKETLAGYKSTITVIITSISIDLGQLTLKQLEDYHRDIANTNSHLLSQLQSVGRRSLNQIGQQEKIREVEDAILCCIQACRKARTSIERVQREHLHDPVSAPEKGIATRKIWKMTENDFEYVRSFFLDSEAKLLSMKEQGDDQRSWLQHLNHCRSILEKKEAEVQQERTLRFENISSKDQAIQVIRSTAATPLWAKDINAEAQSFQILGDSPAAAIEALAEKHGSCRRKNVEAPSSTLFGCFRRRRRRNAL
ncbi:hypothetical protein IFM61392_07759 [Aspergillus lentulus]|uniref:Azaphilone pigments biosynthesis cluster protein L N-terminal domain-containing protein n=1 Tax=Aspergillus lentulus TaxID=293939 RepID=A0ABQ1ADZ2_ASPLE|nr:hypothetical protein IFM60648_05583 [Aspergillus lentulus]GFF80686.1 hypothetical protein IFM62136_10358 [Aspergillus lentulus]GFF97416.1 hypothetical protein IFM47457_11382 [Aspergillus lentulus]GFG13112.1 hypothetical protein IFM61392_07759 [Aspergillus lentulus]